MATIVNNMLTQEQKRIKIAEWQGIPLRVTKWRFSYVVAFSSGYESEEQAIQEMSRLRNMGFYPCDLESYEEDNIIPDYFGDLNAVQKALEQMTDEQFCDFNSELSEPIYKATLNMWCQVYDRRRICASAELRAETLGIALKLWKKKG